jgi:glyceraldehyde-3-phosphate dehydrogenase/erythrose-4-phosphate dehydrogenase
MKKIKVAINGYGDIGKRVADAVTLQDDMVLAGVCELTGIEQDAQKSIMKTNESLGVKQKFY